MTDVRAALSAALREQRQHVVDAVDGLDADALVRPLLPSGWSPLGLIRHLTFDVETFWFEGVVLGRRLDLPSDDDVWHPTEWPRPEQVLDDYGKAAGRSDETLLATELDAHPPRRAFEANPWIPDRDLLATTLHVITETAAHAGHLDAARELIDGRQRLVLTEFTDRQARRQSPR
jgi:hypothetical protein